MVSLSAWTRIYVLLVIFSIAGSVICRFARLDPGAIAPIASALTLIIGVTAIFRSMADDLKLRTYGAFASIVVLGTVVEIIGVSTGIPFGEYAYTDRWKPV